MLISGSYTYQTPGASHAVPVDIVDRAGAEYLYLTLPEDAGDGPFVRCGMHLSSAAAIQSGHEDGVLVIRIDSPEGAEEIAQAVGFPNVHRTTHVEISRAADAWLRIKLDYDRKVRPVERRETR